MKSITQLMHMTWSEINEQIGGVRFFILPTGSIEQHGPHLPLGADLMVAERLASEVTKQFNAIQLPAIPIGVNFAFRNWPGTISISNKTYIQMITEIVENAIQSCKRIMIINGHDENQAPLLISAREAIVNHGAEIVLFEWAELVKKTLRLICESKNEMHAGEGLTSLFSYWFPEHIRSDRIQDNNNQVGKIIADDIHIDSFAYYPKIFHRSEKNASGVFGHPTLASREKGYQIAESLIDQIKQLICELTW